LAKKYEANFASTCTVWQTDSASPKLEERRKATLIIIAMIQSLNC